jgi:hypothetical protein
MKIRITEPKTYMLSDIPVCGVFRNGSHFYMRLDATKDKDTGLISAVCLQTAVYVKFDADAGVSYYPDAEYYPGKPDEIPVAV